MKDGGGSLTSQPYVRTPPLLTSSCSPGKRHRLPVSLPFRAVPSLLPTLSPRGCAKRAVGRRGSWGPRATSQHSPEAQSSGRGQRLGLPGAPIEGTPNSEQEVWFVYQEMLLHSVKNTVHTFPCWLKSPNYR